MSIKGTPFTFFVRVAFISIMLLIAVELFYRFGLRAREYPRGIQDPVTNISYFDNSWVSEGVGSFGPLCKPMGHWRINNAGWNSFFDYCERENYNRPRVAILGNSYIEGLAADVDAHLDVKLFDMFNHDIDIYAFGMSGASFAQYLGTIHYIESQFDPDVYLILLSSFGVSRSLDSSISPYRFYIEKSDSGYVLVDPPEVFVQNRYGRIIFRSALARYLKLNRQVSAQKLDIDVSEMVGSGPISDEIPLEYLSAGQFFVEEFERILPDDKIIFFASSDRLDYLILSELQDSSSSFVLVNLDSYMSADYEEYGIEFHRSYDAHWNNYGHEVVARGLYPYVREALTELGY